MAVRTTHDQLANSIYFVTFTCYKWMHLIEKTNTYYTVYKWFDKLYEKKINVTGYVIMPNHVHVLIHFPEMPKSLNTIIGNAKRFMAYEIIRRLEAAKENELLDTLHAAVSKRERKKGQIHKVFEDSFEAKECYSKEFIYQKLNYIHHNPISGKWNLVNDFTDYIHSSASFYENGIKKYKHLVHINDLLH
jgi:REP element-mobilizing transposase RayT